MNVQQALDLVYARLLGEHSLPVKIRTRQPLCKQEVEALFLAIDFLTTHYKDHELIPKTLASAFVDIHGSFSVSDEVVGEVEARWYEAIGIALQDKAYALLE